MIVTVINQCHLTLKITNVAFEVSFSLLHLDGEKEVTILLELLP